jgi:5-methylcytosine-specific restriction endonuclease McrA
MRWLHITVVLLLLVVGVIGSAGEATLNGWLDPGGSSNAPRDTVLAGKRAGMPFTRKGKAAVKQENAEKNDGKNRCEACEAETVPSQQHQKGVTPPKNEAQVDHVIPRAKGGDGEPDNGQVLCRECNIKKSDKDP